MIRPVPFTRLVLSGSGVDHWGFVAHTCGYPLITSRLFGEYMATLGHNLAIAGALSAAEDRGWEACRRYWNPT